MKVKKKWMASTKYDMCNNGVSVEETSKREKYSPLVMRAAEKEEKRRFWNSNAII